MSTFYTQIVQLTKETKNQIKQKTQQQISQALEEYVAELKADIRKSAAEGIEHSSKMVPNCWSRSASDLVTWLKNRDDMKGFTITHSGCGLINVHWESSTHIY